MRLKLLAPFAIEGFELQQAKILESPDHYEEKWDELAKKADQPLTCVTEIPRNLAESHRFTHASTFNNRIGSRYRAIDAHALPRPLHAMELILRLPVEELVRHLAACRSPLVSDAHQGRNEALEAVESVLVGAIRDAPPRTLVRVFDHGIALLEMDLPIPERFFNISPEESQQIGARLDSLQQLGISLAEALVDRIGTKVVAPLIDWLHEQERFSSTYLRRRPTTSPVGTKQPACAALWVTRSLIVEPGDMLADVGEKYDARHKLRMAVARHWLKDVTDGREVALHCCKDSRAFSTSWLNYFFREGSYGGDYPSDGWRYLAGGQHQSQLRKGENDAGDSSRASHMRAVAFSPAWEAMIIAQCYYAAFDRLQSKISHILAVSVAGEGKRHIAEVKADLDRAVRDANMLKVDFEENRKYYARQVAAKVGEILAGWDFEGGLRRQIDQRIAECSTRLNDLNSRSIERSGVYTDIVLIAIGVTGVFEVLLLLSMYGRTMSADADLAVYDRTSWLNVANWIGASSTDVILLAGGFFSAGLILLYVFFRMSKSYV